VANLPHAHKATAFHYKKKQQQTFIDHDTTKIRLHVLRKSTYPIVTATSHR